MNKEIALNRIKTEIRMCKAKIYSYTGQKAIQLKRLKKLTNLKKELKEKIGDFQLKKEYMKFHLRSS